MMLTQPADLLGRVLVVGQLDEFLSGQKHFSSASANIVLPRKIARRSQQYRSLVLRGRRVALPR